MELNILKMEQMGLIIGIAGIAATIMLLPEARFFAPNEITAENEGELATISGNITALSIAKGNAFFTISGNGNAKAFFYKPSMEQAAILAEGRKIEAIGRIAIYKGAPEIIVQKVRKLD